MRLEDYQRWLDSQFLDVEDGEGKPAPAEAPAIETAPAVPPASPDAEAEADAAAPPSEAAQPADGPVAGAPAEHPRTVAAAPPELESGAIQSDEAGADEPVRSPIVSPGAAEDDGFQVPSIENYFPSLRKRARKTPPEPAVPADEPAPPAVGEIAAKPTVTAAACAAPEAAVEAAAEHAVEAAAAVTTDPGASGTADAAPAAGPAAATTAGEPAAHPVAGAEAPIAEPVVGAAPTVEVAAAVEVAPAEEEAGDALPAQRALDLEGLEPAGHTAVEPPAPPTRRKARHARNVNPSEVVPEMSADELWSLVPRHLQSLVALGTDEVAQNSYTRQFKETRIELVERLLDPTLSLEETARLLNVCPATVRRYTNRGLLTHQRTVGDQRRFKLSDVLAFMEAQSRVGA